jgi:hypothetical protein
LGVEEYYSVVLSHGTAQEIIKIGKIKIGVNELYENIFQKLNNIEQLINVEETNRRTKRDLLLKLGTAFAAIMFGLVGAWRTVEIISDWNELLPSVSSFWRVFLEPIVQLVHSHSIAVALCLYFISILIIIIIFILSIWPSRNSKPIITIDQSQPAQKPGFNWGTRINIVRYDELNQGTNKKDEK